MIKTESFRREDNKSKKGIHYEIDRNVFAFVLFCDVERVFGNEDKKLALKWQ